MHVSGFFTMRTIFKLFKRVCEVARFIDVLHWSLLYNDNAPYTQSEKAEEEGD